MASPGLFYVFFRRMMHFWSQTSYPQLTAPQSGRVAAALVPQGLCRSTDSLSLCLQSIGQSRRNQPLGNVLPTAFIPNAVQSPARDHSQALLFPLQVSQEFRPSTRKAKGLSREAWGDTCSASTQQDGLLEHNAGESWPGTRRPASTETLQARGREGSMGTGDSEAAGPAEGALCAGGGQGSASVAGGC